VPFAAFSPPRAEQRDRSPGEEERCRDHHQQDVLCHVEKEEVIVEGIDRTE
jgi:hypothetical protein